MGVPFTHFLNRWEVEGSDYGGEQREKRAED